MLTLNLQYYGHLVQRADSLEKTLILGKIEGKWRRDWQRMKELGSATDSIDESEQTLGDSEGQGSLLCCSPWSCKESDKPEHLNNNNERQSLPWWAL